MKLKNCNKCSLSKTRKNVVVGKGSLDASIVFLGEAPGKNEDKIGKPFVGRAGKKLDWILEHTDIEDDYYITNVVKCLPKRKNGKNGKPTKEQIKKCGKWLDIQLNKIRPNLIVTLGDYAKNRVLDLPERPLENYAGRIFISERYNLIFVMYHPATLLYNKKKYLPYFKKHIKKLNKMIEVLDLRSEEYWEKI